MSAGSVQFTARESAAQETAAQMGAEDQAAESAGLPQESSPAPAAAPAPRLRVAQLFLHPMKSMKSIAVDALDVDEFGFRHDRAVLLATPVPGRPGFFRLLSQRREPAMVLMETALEGSRLRVRHTSGPTFELDLDRVPALREGSKVVEMTIWDEPVRAADIGAAAGFSAFWHQIYPPGHKWANTTLLVPVERRKTNQWLAPAAQAEQGRDAESGLQDRFPGHLVCTASVAELNERLETSTVSGVQVKPNHFRPNIVVETDTPYEEDAWLKIAIAGHVWFVPTWCPRCEVPSVNIERGAYEKTRQPNALLNAYRRLDPTTRDPVFGMSLINKSWGYTIRVGDTVEVLETVQRPREQLD